MNLVSIKGPKEDSSIETLGIGYSVQNSFLLVRCSRSEFVYFSGISRIIGKSEEIVNRYRLFLFILMKYAEENFILFIPEFYQDTFLDPI